MAASNSGQAVADRSTALRRRSRRVSMAFPSREMHDDALRRLAPRLTKAGEPIEVEPSRPSKRTCGGASIGPNQVPRDGPLVAYAGLHFFESVCQGADRPGQHEQSAA